MYKRQVSGCSVNSDGDVVFRLYSADAERWRAVRETLDERVVADLRASSAYWAQFEGLADTVSNAVYDGFLKSNGDTDGSKSYGVVTDLLVAYFG